MFLSTKFESETILSSTLQAEMFGGVSFAWKPG